MLSEQSTTGFTQWSELSRLTTRAELAIEQNKSDTEAVKQLLARRNDLLDRSDRLASAINRCTSIYKDVKDNLTEKKRVSLEDYRAAIQESSKIVPDSNVEDMSLMVDDKRAVIVNSRGHDLNEREGSAERSTVGLLMRYISMVKQPVYAIPMLLFDETFFTLSNNTCEEMREYLIEISKHMLIIAIEQKDTLFIGVPDKTVYRFIKDNNKTRIQLEE